MDTVERLNAALSERYAIERELGAGGMATVYLAEDLRHHRKVALKVLRPEIAATLGAGRFAREIEVAARLQHPNILPLLDSGEADGVFFYVMPFVQGESLRDRLARGGELPIPDAVRILMEVADALSHAHANGVVHRDIKPDNVMLSGRHALVADFGVAKAVTAATGYQLLTSTGVALGTPTYMAPEQATADPHQDHRVDIYALGVLGYELLTGRAPFSAMTAQEMLAAHVTAEPEPLERYRSTVSPALAAVVMKCLAKKPADRWQTADEVLVHLEPLVTPTGGVTPTQTRPIIAFGQLPRWVPWTAGPVAIAAIALVASQLLKPGALTISVSDVAPVTSDPGVEFQPAISPDGRMVVYAAGPIGAPHLEIRSTVAATVSGEIRLADTSFTSQFFPAWTSDGEAIRFWGCRASCVLYEAGKLGGAIRLVTVPNRPGDRYAWSADGSRVAFVHADTIFAASVTDTTARIVGVHTSQFWALHSLAWSPDGRRIAYVNGNAEWRTSGNVAGSSIWVVAAAGGEPAEITTAAALNASPAWLDAHRLLFVSNRDGPRAVYVVEVGSSGPRGEPRIVPGVADPHSISYAIGARRLAWAKFTLRQNIWAYPLRASRPVSLHDGNRVTTGNQVIESHDVSPDNRWIVFDNSRSGHPDLFKMLLAGGEPVPLTDTPWDEEGPRWSPDGGEIAYYVGRAGTWSNWVMPSGGGAPVALPSAPGLNFGPIWSPDRLRIAFVSRIHGAVGCWLVARQRPAAAWQSPIHLLDTCLPLDWAPDGSGFLSPIGAEGNPEAATLVLVSATGQVSRRALPAASMLRLDVLRLSRDGQTIYAIGTHRDGRRGVWAIPVAGVGTPRLAVAFDDPALGTLNELSVGPDRLYLTVAEYESDIWVANLHW